MTDPITLARRTLLGLLAGLFLAGGQAALAAAADPGIAVEEPGSGLAGTESLDTTSLTTDHSTNTPTSWWTYNGVSPTQVSTYLSANGARLADIQVQSVSGGVPALTVRMVRNSGSYAAAGGWWWYYGLTSAQVTSYLNANSARLIDIEPYDIGGGNIRFAVIMVNNTGAAARSWWWYHGVTTAQIGSFLNTNGARLVDLDHYIVGGVKRYTAVMVRNTGSDAKAWQWWYGQTLSSLTSKVSSFNGRVVKIDRESNGTYNFVQVRNTGTDYSAWWHYYGFTTLGGLNDYANQLAVRPVTISTYLDSLGRRRWDAAFIDNANASTRRMRNVYGKTFLDANGNPTRGIFEAYLKQVGSTTLVSLNPSRQAETASSLKALHLLHAMKQVQLGNTTLGSTFTYYNYPDGSSQTASNKCPDPIYEVAGNRMTNYTLEQGLDEMMRISDNRTTRGVVLRYGMAALNSTGVAAGLKSTQLRHNIGCAYRSLGTGKYVPSSLRNNTTAADLARIYESVWQGSSLTSTNAARTEFLESANPASGAYASLQTIINAEAAALGKSTTVAAQFGAAVRRWSKGGSYGTCLPNSLGDCGQKVIIRSAAGLIQLPFKSAGVVAPRVYSYANLVSDVPVSCWEDGNTSAIDCPSDTNYSNAFSAAQPELFREIVRAGLRTW